MLCWRTVKRALSPSSDASVTSDRLSTPTPWLLHVNALATCTKISSLRLSDAGVLCDGPVAPYAPPRNIRRQHCPPEISVICNIFLSSAPTKLPDSSITPLTHRFPLIALEISITMAPYPVLNASSSSLNPFLPSYPTLPHSTTTTTLSQSQTQWNPDAIGTVFFGALMFLIGVTALWQGRRSGREDGPLGPSFYSFLFFFCADLTY